ncbi:MAG: signal peptidase II [Patescibacteria group bacterium]
MVFVDQLTKDLFFSSVVNHGVSFGLFSSWMTWVGVWMVVIFPLVLLIFVWSVLKKYPIVLGLLQGGAVSNLLDRLLYGGVRDWLPVPVLFSQFGLRNNLADWAIVGALIVFFFIQIRKDRSMV